MCPPLSTSSAGDPEPGPIVRETNNSSTKSNHDAAELACSLRVCFIDVNFERKPRPSGRGQAVGPAEQFTCYAPPWCSNASSPAFNNCSYASVSEISRSSAKSFTRPWTLHEMSTFGLIGGLNRHGDVIDITANEASQHLRSRSPLI
jgi:hypothetical protein